MKDRRNLLAPTEDISMLSIQAYFSLLAMFSGYVHPDPLCEFDTPIYRQPQFRTTANGAEACCVLVVYTDRPISVLRSFSQTIQLQAQPMAPAVPYPNFQTVLIAMAPLARGSNGFCASMRHS